LLAHSSLCAAQTGANWNYSGKTGALVWGRLDPAYKACSKGHDQSPIDMRGARLDAKLQPIEFHYMGGAITLENTGNAIVAVVDPGSYIVANGVRYNLVDFEFHHPSEWATGTLPSQPFGNICPRLPANRKRSQT